jgi:hypothetical protein
VQALHVGKMWVTASLAPWSASSSWVNILQTTARPERPV